MSSWSINQGLDLCPSGDFASSASLRSLFLLQVALDILFLFIHDVLELFLKGFSLFDVVDHLWNTPNSINGLNNNDNILTWFLEINNPKTVNRQVETHSFIRSDRQIGKVILIYVFTDRYELHDVSIGLPSKKGAFFTSDYHSSIALTAIWNPHAILIDLR